MDRTNGRSESTRDFKPQKVNTDTVELLRRLARFGHTNLEIASILGIAHNTFDRYYREVEGFRQALDEGRLYDSMKVVDSLHKQALGYMVDEIEVAQTLNKQGEVIELTKVTTKHIHPNVTAAIYLLKTRHGDKWMDIVRTEATQNLNIMVKNVDFSDMSDEELIILKKLGIKKIPEEFKFGKPKLPEHIQNAQDVRGN